MDSDCLENTTKVFGIDMNTVDLPLTRTTDLEQDIGYTVPDPYTNSPKLTFHDDPVVLSCAAWRIGNEGGGLWTELEDIKVITEQDRVLGAAVRKHYLDQLVMAKLRGKNVSPFRTKLGAFLVGNHDLTKREIGMLYRLPYFYHEDLAVAEVMNATAPLVNQSTIRLPIAVATDPAQLECMSQITQYRQSANVSQFWFRDPYGYPLMFALRHDNHMHGVMESLFARGHMTIAGRKISIRPFYGEQNRNYINMHTFRLANIDV